jgi:hypothetical protein
LFVIIINKEPVEAGEACASLPSDLLSLADAKEAAAAYQG